MMHDNVLHDDQVVRSGSDELRPYVIVFGNEKGGSGKSTSALHVMVSLLRQGKAVGSLDIDARQGTLSRYLENRQVFMRETGIRLPMPENQRLYRSEADSRSSAEAEERDRLDGAFAAFAGKDFIVIDTPGSDTYLSRLAHQRADTLITPLNDSFIDLDLLGRVDRAGRKILGPSVYSQMVWEQRQLRARAGGRPIDWIVMRNRMSHLDARNKREIAHLLTLLAKRIGFRLAPGFAERVIFRELFAKGLTLLDLKQSHTTMTMSHVAARNEVRSLLEIMALPGVAEAAMATPPALTPGERIPTAPH
ncbi:MAG: division plane positioning ATPase MipZ [Rhodospirillales bacterium]